VKRKHRWLVVGLLLTPVAIGALMLLVDAAGGAGDLLPSTRKVAIVRIDDVIISSESVVEQLRDYADDGDIAGVVLRINSPGGAVAPSQEIYRAVLRFREGSKPIVASMENLAASGGYYVASAASRIFANPGTITGSIGVVLPLSHFYRLFDKLGIDFETLKAGRYKDIGSPNRKMTSEERRLLQGVLDDTHRQFVEDVCAGRGMNCDSLRAIAEGQVFTGRQALALRLVDTLGGLDDAVSYVKQITGLPRKAETCEKRANPAWWDLLPAGLARTVGAFRATLYPGGIYYLYGSR
jgi:protease-4